MPQVLLVDDEAAIRFVLSDELAEAQLFGHARGAFKGAVNAHTGYFVQANGGTVVLDEIGELTLPLQSKLLRVIGPASFALIQSPSAADASEPEAIGARGPSFREHMDAFERNLLTSALVATANDQSQAARRLGLTRATLYDRLKNFDLLPDAARANMS